MRHSRGAEQMLRTFLIRKKSGEPERSEIRPERKVKRATSRPMMVRYWKCQP